MCNYQTCGQIAHERDQRDEEPITSKLDTASLFILRDARFAYFISITVLSLHVQVVALA